MIHSMFILDFVLCGVPNPKIVCGLSNLNEKSPPVLAISVTGECAGCIVRLLSADSHSQRAEGDRSEISRGHDDRWHPGTVPDISQGNPETKT